MSTVYPVREWFALRVRSRYEQVVTHLLHSKGYETFLPLYKTRRVWSDRVATLTLPLFPGYVFCRFDLNDRAVPILTTPGVIRIIGLGSRPEPIEEQEISALQKVVNAGLAIEPCPYVALGSTVTISFGALCGVQGIVSKLKKQQRLVLSVTLLQRSVSVEVDAAWLAPDPVTWTSHMAPSIQDEV